MDDSQKNLLGADHDANAGSIAPMPPKPMPPMPPIPPASPVSMPSAPPVPPKTFSSLPSSLGASAPPPRPSFAPTGGVPASRPMNVPPPPPLSSAPKPFFPSAPTMPSRPAVASVENKTPAPSAPSVNIRSMSSDAQTLKESGGIAPKPQTIKLETLEDNVPMPTPITNNQLPAGIVEGGSNKFKTVFEVLLVFAVAVGLGFVGYYFIYPLVFSTKNIAPEVVNNKQPVVVENKVVAKADKKEVTLMHNSLFLDSVKAQANVSLTDLTPVDIIGALQVEAKKVAVAGTLKEINLQQNGAQVSFSKYFSALLSGVSVGDAVSAMDEDFTGFMYYDEKGVWPGYVAHIRKDATPDQIAKFVTDFENADVAKLYVAEPGSADGFKNGPYKNVAVRYAKFTKPGASLNYGVFGELLVISTSFNGLKASVTALGL